jgi:hypothetical protein
MFRAKIGLITAAVVLALTGAVYFSLTGGLSESIRKDVETRVKASAKLAQQSAQLDALRLTTLPTTYAKEDEFQKGLSVADSNEKRRLLFAAVEARNARLAAVGSRKADIIAVTDERGRVVVRDLDPNNLTGEDFRARYPSIDLALKGTANKDVWNFDNKPYRVAAAPVRAANGQVLGVVVVGYVMMTDREAREKAREFGTDVAYLVDGRIVTTSLTVAGEAEKEDAERGAELGRIVFGSGSPVQAALAKAEPGDSFTINVRGEEFLAVAASLPGNSNNKTTGLVALKSLTVAMAPVGRAGGLVLLLGVLCLLVALGAGVMTARRFLGPLDHIEAGVAEVINGNLDYSFDQSSPDFEGLANALNVMLARLLGRPEPSEDDDGDQAAEKRWKADGMFEDVDTAQAAGGAAVADHASLALAQETADAYYQRTFNEYVAAKRQVGERTDSVNFDSFRAKLAQNETALKGKYKCKMVRFKVTMKGNQVTLKPVPIY